MEVLDDDGRQQVDQQLEDWRQGDCVVGEQWFLFRTKKDRFVDVAGVVTTLDDLTAREYVESDPLDLEHLSSREG